MLNGYNSILEGDDLKKHIFFVLLIVCLALLLVACSASNDLVGKWKTETGFYEMEFTNDNMVFVYQLGEQVIFGYPYGEQNLTGYYIIDDDILTVTVNGEDAQTMFEISGDKLTITDPLGISIDLYRSN